MEKIKGFLNIAKKAGYVVYGGDALKAHTKKLYLILYTKEASPNLMKILENVSKKYQIEMLELNELGNMLSSENIKAIGIKNMGLSNEIAKLIKGN